MKLFSRIRLQTDQTVLKHSKKAISVELWLQRALRKFLCMLETCFRYVTQSPNTRLSNGTKIMAIEALDKIWHPYFKKRGSHLPFESYFSKSKCPRVCLQILWHKFCWRVHTIAHRITYWSYFNYFLDTWLQKISLLKIAFLLWNTIEIW